MKARIKIVLYLLSVNLLAILAAGNLSAQENDVKGSKDHPMISRYPGSSIMRYDRKEFDEYVLPLDKVIKGKLKNSQKLEGKITQITYAAPGDKSILEIYRNYEIALKKAGFQTLFSGKKELLGDKEWLKAFVGAVSRPVPYGGAEIGTHLEGNYSYLAAKKAGEEGDIYISLCVGGSWFQKYPVVQLDVVEVKPMDTGLITVNAEEMAKDINKIGHVVIYGIYFDTGKADVKAESEKALAEIAKLLQQHPKLNLYVVGHTDNVGALTSNMELSRQRAEAVVKILVSKNGIDTKRLHPAGVGPLAAVASNKTPEGRAKNRRVELVEQ